MASAEIAEPPPIALTSLSDSTAETGNNNDNTRLTEPPEGRQEFSLPPVDRGKDAILFLVAAFVVEALTWGFCFSFGLFQEYYSKHEPFAGQSNIAVIGTCAMGVMYLSAVPLMTFNRLFPRLARWMPLVGLIIMCFALAMSSFSTTVTHLIVTQGVFYGIGGGIAYIPCILYMDEWFVKRKGLAYGIMWSGAGGAGVALPLLLEHFLNEYGYKTTLRIWSGMLFGLTAPLAYFLKPRVPVASTTRPKPISFAFVLSPMFAMYQITNIIEALGFFLPGIYLPSYARDTLDAGSFPSALTILLNNVASVVGCIVMGWLSDRLHVTTCLMISTVGATLGTFLLWGFASNLGMLYVFSVVYGLFAGSFTSAWAGIMKEVASYRGRSRSSAGDAQSTNNMYPPMVIGVLAAGRGIGNVVSGPLSELLVKGRPWEGDALGAYGSGYGSLIVFTGVTAFAGGASFLCRRVGWL